MSIPKVGAIVLLAGVLAVTARTSARQAPAAGESGGAPRLIVLLVMDQFTRDYVGLYSQQWTKGLRRLFDEGAVFTQAAYPYGGTVTCAGHTTIGTGALPQRHGMVGNSWYNRDLDKAVTCEEDPSVEPIALGTGTTTNRHSALYMKVPTLADELRRQLPRRPNIVSLAEKPRSAIGMGGHGGPGTVVLWESTGGVWATSTAYTAEPWDDVREFMQRRPLSGDYGALWTRLLPESEYRFEDDDPAESRPTPWGRTFPHTLHSPNGPSDPAFVGTWQRSPYSDAFVIDLATHLVQTRKLGQESGTDMLAVSLGALDASGHQYGPRSHEVQDILARADLAIGRLLESLDNSVGRGGYVVAFSADHGIARIPEEATGAGVDAGRLGSIASLAEGILQWMFGAGKHLGLGDGAQVSLTRATLAKLQRQPELEALFVSALKSSPGVAKVFTRRELTGTDQTRDADLQAWRLTYMPDRSGDYIVVTKPGWVYGATGTNHGSPHAYDRQVPLVLFGAGIRPGSYAASASPADIAPTLAALARISLPSAQGRVLAEALAR